MIRPSKHDRPDGWLQRVFLEAIARVRLWPPWKRRAIQCKLYQENFHALMSGRCNSGLDPLDTRDAANSIAKSVIPLEFCGKIPSECTCLQDSEKLAAMLADETHPGWQEKRTYSQPIRVSEEMVHDLTSDGLKEWVDDIRTSRVESRRRAHKSTIDHFAGI